MLASRKKVASERDFHDCRLNECDLDADIDCEISLICKFLTHLSFVSVLLTPKLQYLSLTSDVLSD